MKQSKIKVEDSSENLPRLLPQLIQHLNTDKIRQKRWFQHKQSRLLNLKLKDYIIINEDTSPRLLIITVIKLKFSSSSTEDNSAVYYFPLVSSKNLSGVEDCWLTINFTKDNCTIYIGEAVNHHNYYKFLRKQALTNGKILMKNKGELIIGGFSEKFKKIKPEAAHSLTNISSNSITALENYAAKNYRNLERGINPELEITEALMKESNFSAFPQIIGYMNYIDAKNNHYTLCIIEEFLENEGSAWEYCQQVLQEKFKSAETIPEQFYQNIKNLGITVADFHAAVSHINKPGFTKEKPTLQKIKQWIQKNIENLKQVKHQIENTLKNNNLSEKNIGILEKILDQYSNIRDKLKNSLTSISEPGFYIRIHGDLHLEQILKKEEMFYLLDFEGEPLLPIKNRRQKQSPLKDVAGILRSFNYLGYSFLLQKNPKDLMNNSQAYQYISDWEERACTDFLQGYRQRLSRKNIELLPPDPYFKKLLNLFQLEKALYEFLYEINNRPQWLFIPAQGILDCINIKEEL